MTSRLTFLAIAMISVSCSLNSREDGIEIFSINYAFTQGDQGWQADFTDYPVGATIESDSIYHWNAQLVGSQPNLDAAGAYMLSCNNVNGDIFMFLKRRVSGLRPNTYYSVVYEISLCSDAAAGQGIVLKAGASDLEPKKVIENGYYVLNIDKGANTTSGEYAVSFGDIGSNYTGEKYNRITKGNSNSSDPFLTKTNSKGELWLVVGTDSLFEGPTSVYFYNINLVFSASE